MAYCITTPFNNSWYVVGKVDANLSKLDTSLYTVTFLDQSSKGDKAAPVVWSAITHSRTVQCHANTPDHQSHLSGQDTRSQIAMQQTAVNAAGLTHASLIGTRGNVVTPSMPTLYR